MEGGVIFVLRICSLTAKCVKDYTLDFILGFCQLSENLFGGSRKKVSVCVWGEKTVTRRGRFFFIFLKKHCLTELWAVEVNSAPLCPHSAEPVLLYQCSLKGLT